MSIPYRKHTAILENDVFPRLQCLSIRGCEGMDQLSRVIANSNLMDRLMALDLSYCGMTDKGARFLLDNGKIARLKMLDLSSNCLSEKMVQSLAALCTETILKIERQHP